MFSRIRHSITFRLEQFLMSGPLSRFALILLLVVLVSLVAGALVHLIAPGSESFAEAFWWAFLRLSDPGYLGDDKGVVKATISTAITVLGYILFMGALVAILVQWLSDTTARLERGLTPVALDAHLVLLGWSSRTPAILKEIMVSQGRLERFLRRRGVPHLQVALLAENAGATLMQQIKLQLGEHWNAWQIILRSGSPLRLEDLERVDFAHAGVIVVPAADTTISSVTDADTRTMKTLMTLGAALEQDPPQEPPLVVVELQDPRHTGTLRALYRGPMEIIAGDEIIADFMVQTVRHPGLSHVYVDTITDAAGSQIYVREESQLTGVPAHQLTHAFPEAVLLGVVRPQGDSFRALLNPPTDLRLEAGDRIAVLASSYKSPAPPETVNAYDAPRAKPAPESRVPRQRRVLVLGWNHRVPLMLSGFASYPREKVTIDIVSQVSVARRERLIAARRIAAEQLEIRQVDLDYTVPDYLQSVDPAGYDNVVLLASERLTPGAESDARTIRGYLLLRELTAAGAEAPQVLIELTDPDNITLFDNRHGEIIVSPLIVSHMLARVTLRRELRAVFDELFGPGGCEIGFHRIADYGLAEILSQMPDYGLTGGEYTFAHLQQATHARGEIAIGIRWAGQRRTPHGGVKLNPGRDERLQLSDKDELIVLTNHA